MHEGDACKLPTELAIDEETAVRKMLAGKRIAVVGVSTDPYRPSHDIAKYLINAGYDVIPVNPNHDDVLGRKCYPSLRSAPGPIDVVNVFRRPEHCADVARDAVAVGAKGIWLQSGIENADAEQIARAAGVAFVQDRCIKVDHMMRAR